MAIAKMSKLNLVAMSYDRDGILNSLQRTGATEIKLHYEAENTRPAEIGCEELRAYLNSLEGVLSRLVVEVAAQNKENKIKSDALDDGFSVTFSEFTSAKNFKAEADEITEKAEALFSVRKKTESELFKLVKTLQTAKIYSYAERPLNEYAGTSHTLIKLGTVPSNVAEGFFAEAENESLISVTQIAAEGEFLLAVVAAHKSAASRAEELLQKFGFSACPFSAEARTGAEYYADLLAKQKSLEEKISATSKALYAFNEKIKPLKTYCDYVRFELEKLQLTEKMRVTQATILMEAYVPDEQKTCVSAALDGVTENVYYEFSEPTKEDAPPTLYKNNKVVKNFEAVTNMYSPANYREFDPNAVMAVFYSIFLGFIMADIGYGLIMLLGGGAIYLKTRAKASGLTRLAGVFAIGGICTVIWGILFNSLFGASVLPFTVMPPLRDEGSMWSLMGINVPAVLIISMLIGIIQLAAGYVCKAVQYWRRGYVWDGIWEGLTWALFCIGAFLAVIGLTKQFNAPVCTTVGGIIAAVGLGLAILTAGRHEKFFGKFTKGFGAAYGVINFASDILSYARLYGLLLSGAVIAQIVTGYAVTGVNGGVGFVMSGNPALIILGIVILVVGHAFNLAMGLLGAYIHDARLQYVEFYGRFFEGEGELFTPLGSGQKYINLLLK